MKITIECNSIEELRNFCFESGYLVSQERLANLEAATEKSNEYDDNKKITVAAVEEPREEAPAPAKEEPADQSEKVKIEDIRKLLSVVNKKTGTNTAREWVKEAGFKSLADITDQKILMDLKAKAEEVLNAE